MARSAGAGWSLATTSAPIARRTPLRCNLDVIAHEVGHLIVYGIVGEPDPARRRRSIWASRRPSPISSALLVAAHLDPVVDQVMQRTRGNLYVANELNRLGELSSTTQIRIASNATRMSEFALGWSDEHDLSEPLTGAVFDLLLDIYQANLVERGLIPRKPGGRSRRARGHLRAFAPMIQAEYDRWYPRAPQEFPGALPTRATAWATGSLSCCATAARSR